MKGGYSLIDATGLNLGNVGTVDGIYAKLMTAYKANKFVLLSGVVNGTAKFTPIPAFLATETVESATVIILTIMNLPYRVSSDNSIVQA